MSPIRVSPKHGLNPSMTLCFACGAETGIALLGFLRGDEEAPRRIMHRDDICDNCKKLMGHGVILMQVQNGELGQDHPIRTGRMCCIPDATLSEGIKDADILKSIIKERLCFVEEKTWVIMGLPNPPIEELKHGVYQTYHRAEAENT
jgi:hypothetical protein